MLLQQCFPTKPDQLADWIEEGLRIGGVVEAKIRRHPIEPRTSTDPNLWPDETYMSQDSPLIKSDAMRSRLLAIKEECLDRVVVNVIGAAFVGCVGNAKEAWCLYKRYGGLDDTRLGLGLGDQWTSRFTGLMGLTVDQAAYVLGRFLDWDVRITSRRSMTATDIALALRTGQVRLPAACQNH